MAASGRMGEPLRAFFSDHLVGLRVRSLALDEADARSAPRVGNLVHEPAHDDGAKSAALGARISAALNLDAKLVAFECARHGKTAAVLCSADERLTDGGRNVRPVFLGVSAQVRKPGNGHPREHRAAGIAGKGGVVGWGRQYGTSLATAPKNAIGPWAPAAGPGGPLVR